MMLISERKKVDRLETRRFSFKTNWTSEAQGNREFKRFIAEMKFKSMEVEICRFSQIRGSCEVRIVEKVKIRRTFSMFQWHEDNQISKWTKDQKYLNEQNKRTKFVFVLSSFYLQHRLCIEEMHRDLANVWIPSMLWWFVQMFHEKLYSKY